MNEWQKPDIGRPYLFGIIGVIVLIVFGWLYYDHHRNEPTYTNTDTNLADVEKRIDRIESRLTNLQGRIEQSEKTISGIAEGIGKSTSLAESVASGIQGTEDRIDQAIQRSGRIANIIAEVERINRPGTQDSQATGVAK